ncbi:MAG: hypothetical protein DJ555_04225 [Desulfurococcaceae archaeon]|nr:MAG: hypothetical protein DJ555_04225 [Desulfurococcaceae archaeon]
MISVSLSIKIPYRVEDLLTIELPEPLLSLKPRLIQSRISPDTVYVETEIGDVLVRPLIGLKSNINRPWVYHDVSKVCFNNMCKDLGKIFKAASLSDNTIIVIGEGKSYLAELSEDSIRTRPVNVKEILGSVRYVDRSVVLIREKGFRKRVLATDHGFLYAVTSFCMEKREGYAVVAFETGGYTRIYFGAEHGGYVIYDTNSPPVACTMGYRVATIALRNRGSVYIGKGLYLETPLRSVGIAWIPEDRVLILYDQKGGWLLESDLRSLKPIARLPGRPTYLGRLRDSDSHVLMVNGELIVIKGSLIIKPEIRLDGYRYVSTNNNGLVIDSGENLTIRSVEGKEIWSVKKDPDTLCGGYGDKIVCIKKNMISVIEPSEGEVVIEKRVGEIPGVIISGCGKIPGVSVSGDVDVINITRVDGNIEITMAPRVLGKTSRSYIELGDIITKHGIEVEIVAEPPKVTIEHARIVVSRTGLHMECGSPGYAEVVLKLSRNRFHDLYRYVARVISRGRIIGLATFHPGSNNRGEEKTELRICLEEAPIEGDAWLEITAIKSDLKGFGGEAFYRAPLAVEIKEPVVTISLEHYSDKSEMTVKIDRSREVVGNIYVNIKCTNMSFEKTERGKGLVRITIGGCEVPARIVTVIEDQGFKWITSREIHIHELAQCVEEYAEIAGLIDMMCTKGGFYKHIPPISHKDLSPIKEAKVINLPGRGSQILIIAERNASYMVTALRTGYVVGQGRLSPGINMVNLGLTALLEPLKLSIFSGAAYREYLLEPENILEMISTALRTSYKLLEIMGGLGL